MNWEELLTQGAVVLTSMLAGLPVVEARFRGVVRRVVREELEPVLARVAALESKAKTLPPEGGKHVRAV